MALTLISICSGKLLFTILTVPLFKVATVSVPFWDLVTLVSWILILFWLLESLLGVELLGWVVLVFVWFALVTLLLTGLFMVAFTVVLVLFTMPLLLLLVFTWGTVLLGILLILVLLESQN